MKPFLTKSVVIALSIGPLSTFVDRVVSTHNAAKYDPPVSESVMEGWKKLPVAEMQAKFDQRRIHLSRTQWLADSIACWYFWKTRAKSSSVPAPGISSASLVLGFWERPDGRSLS